MLSHLTIRDLAVVEEACLELSPGLNVLTGETGAGKSVIVDALELLRGAPRPRARVREGAATGSVEAQFLPSPEARARLLPVLEKYDLGLHDELILGRRLEAGGRTRAYVQGRLVPRHVLAEVGEELVEICGQHESHSLRSAAAQLAALDRFAGLGAEVERFAAVYGSAKAAAARLDEAIERRRRAAARRDLVEFQLAELSSCAGFDYREGRRRLELADSAAQLEALAAEIQQLLEDGEGAAAERLGWLLKRTRLLAKDPAWATEPQLGVLEGCLLRALDGVQEASRVAAALMARECPDAGELDRLNQQLAEIERLARKHRRAPEELGSFAAELGEELTRFQDLEEEIPELERAAAALREEAEKAAAALHERRARGARRLEDAVAQELALLCLPGAALGVQVQAAALSPSGATQVELQFSANPGHPAAPLGRVASGGELSRVLLALKVASRHGQGTAVFDEIDAGAGGHVAERIGERLRHAARSAQVICVTHWPQVAAFADAHWVVCKSGAVAATRVRRVEGDERLDELSRMLGGRRRSARSHAAHLLELALQTPAAAERAA